MSSNTGSNGHLLKNCNVWKIWWIDVFSRCLANYTYFEFVQTWGNYNFVASF